MTTNPFITFPLPDVVNPGKTVCLKVDIPDAPYYRQIFNQVIFALTYWYAYDRDPAHLGRQIAALWMEAYMSIRTCDDKSSAIGSAGVDTEPMIRQNPTNPCILESSLDGVNWCEWADISKCIPGVSQPGAGTGTPTPNGGTKQYCYPFNANSSLLIPTVVNTGDVLSLDKATGGGTNGVTLAWFCPNGQSLFFDTCSGEGSYSSGNPLPSAKSMALIYNIGGTYFDATQGPVTVPSGVVNQQVTLQTNTPYSSSAQGSYDVCVTVKNNKVSQYSHSFNFLLQSGPFVPWVTGGVTLGHWVANTGWVSDSAGASTQEVTITSTISAPISSIVFTLDVLAAPVSPHHSDIVRGSPTGTSLLSQPLVLGVQSPSIGGLSFSDVFTISGFNNITGSGDLVITGCVVTGPGPDPYAAF